MKRQERKSHRQFDDLNTELCPLFCSFFNFSLLSFFFLWQRLNSNESVEQEGGGVRINAEVITPRWKDQRSFP